MVKTSDITYSLKGKDLSTEKPRGGLTYFDILEGLAALALAAAYLALLVANRPSWVWNLKDSLGLGLFLATIPAFIFLRRYVSAQGMPWLRACVAASTLAAVVVLCRRWPGMWVGVGTMILLFTLCLWSKTVFEVHVRQVISRGLMVIGGMLFGLLLTEGILRLMPELLPQGARARVLQQVGVDLPWHVPHPYIGHLLNIEHLRTVNAGTKATTAGAWRPARFDAWGFRNAEPWPERVDIITVGDSWTYSMPVNDAQAWPELLAQALAPRRVLNLGLPGAGPQQYLRIYEVFGAKLSPKVLLVCLDLGSDLWDALDFDSWWRAQSLEGAHKFSLKQERSEVRGGMQKSYLYTLLKDMRASYGAGVFLQEKTVSLADGSRIQLNPRLLEGQARLGYPGQPAFMLVLETLEHLQALATQQQTHCLVLFFPFKEEVYLPVFGEAAADLAAPFLPELDRRGIAYLDLGPHFRQRAATGETLFWEMDSHPNVRGYALIAEVVLAHLQEHAARYGLD